MNTASVALVWAAFFTFVHRGARWWLRSSTFAEEKRRACEYAIPSLIHATIAVVWALFVLYPPASTSAEGPFVAHGSMHAYTDASRALSSFALGYFVWDLVESVRHNLAWQWKVHALMSMVVFAVSAGVLAPPLLAWYTSYVSTGG